MKKLLIGFVALVLVIGGGYVLLHKSPTKPATTTSSQTQNTGQSPGQSSASTITFDGTMFSPASITVKSGSTITIKNTSSQDLQMDSNPHPVHTDDTDLNVGLVSAGHAQSFTVTKTGTFGYHDHLDPSIQGKITIQ